MLVLWNHIRWSCSLQKCLSAWQDSLLPPSSTFSRPWAGLVLMQTPQVPPCSVHQSRLCQSSRRFVMVRGVSQILGQYSYVPIVQQQQNDHRGREMKDAVGKSPELCLICLTEHEKMWRTQNKPRWAFCIFSSLCSLRKVMFSFSSAFDAWM